MQFRFSKDFVVDSAVEPWKSEGIRIGFYSAPGTRKSFTVAACIVEPFLDEGGTVVIFEPRSEWHTLKQRYESVLVVGGPFQDIPLAVNQARVYAEAIVKHGASMVFDFSEIDQKDLVRFAAELLARIFTLQNVVRRPLLLFIEEGSDYCPLSTKGKLVEPWIFARMTDRITKIATQGRPLGFMLAITSQRPAQLNYTVRMMCNLSFYGKFHPKDLTDIKEVLKPYPVPIKATAEKCVSMPHGSWLAITSEGAKSLSITAKRKTPHGADTPKLEQEATRTKKTINTIGELSKTILEAMEREKAEESEREKDKRTIRTLKEKLAAAEEIAKIKLSVKDLLEGGEGATELAEKLATAKTKLKTLQKKLAEKPPPEELEKRDKRIKFLEGRNIQQLSQIQKLQKELELFTAFKNLLRKIGLIPSVDDRAGFEPAGTTPSMSTVEIDERIKQRLLDTPNLRVVTVDVNERVKELVKSSYVQSLEAKIKALSETAVKAALWLHERRQAQIGELYFYLTEKRGRPPGNFYTNVVKPLERAWLIFNESGNVQWILEEKLSELKELRNGDVQDLANYLTSLLL